MFKLTNKQRQEVCVLRARNSSLEAARIFSEMYPQRASPLSYTTVDRIWNKWNETGALKDRHRSGRPSKRKDENVVLSVLATAAENSRQSIKEISESAGVCSAKTTWKILRDNKYFPYKAQMHQKLNEPDPVARRNFCEDMRLQLNNDPTILRQIMWSDESKFQCRGSFNRQNNR